MFSTRNVCFCLEIEIACPELLHFQLSFYARVAFKFEVKIVLVIDNHQELIYFEREPGSKFVHGKRYNIEIVIGTKNTGYCF